MAGPRSWRTRDEKFGWRLLAVDEEFDRCLLAADEDVGRLAPLTADEDVGRRFLAADEEVSWPARASDEEVGRLAADEDVDRPAMTSARPDGGQRTRRLRRRRTLSQLSASSLSQSLEGSELESF